MNTIINNKESILEVKKSKFICILLKEKSTDQIKNIINEYRKKYPKATHYCYAYVINNQKKSSDDGEPGGSAGIPILEVLNKNNLNNVLCIVIRYFGGIKLGMGGLIRAYTDSVSNTLKDNITEEIEYASISFNSDYSSQNKIDNLLKDYKVKKEYLDNITYLVEIPVKNLYILDGIEYEIKNKYTN